MWPGATKEACRYENKIYCDEEKKDEDSKSLHPCTGSEAMQLRYVWV